jgi:hypothetical protein
MLRVERLLLGVSLLLLAGCGSGGNAVAVTPILADTTGSYALQASSVTISAPGGANSFNSYSGGTLRLFPDNSYTRAVTDGGQQTSSGSYQIGNSPGTIPNSRQGSFSLTSSDPPNAFAGNYLITGDFSLALTFDPYRLPADGSLVARTETWIKLSDSPRR